MKTILVPTDLSPLSALALPIAISLANQYGAEVRVLHYLATGLIAPELSGAPIAIGRYLDEQAAEARQALDQLCSHYQTAEVPVTPVLSRHEAGLYGAMASENADLIVVASHGSEGWAEWLVGSNAEHIVQAVHSPVLVVKQAHPELSLKKILFAIDADDRLKTQFTNPLPVGNSHLEFLFVTTPNDPRAPEGIRDWMSELAEARQLTDYHLSIIPHHTAHEGIIQFAEQHQFDLIVLFTNQRTGFWHFFNGSVAEDVVNHAQLPVLVVPLREDE
ncbi:nucleotide-binding universal stress UspA family protein [Spirosoma lacussanchae]|uniref:universal stress protein n=1 Tax=Spirosoma lacussanchae TaxID=1884249 RepID=UPI0011098396|nr:universal stress protein [Spirosoma lacussanchae]